MGCIFMILENFAYIKKRKKKGYSNALVDSLDCDHRTFACLGGTFLETTVMLINFGKCV